MAFAMVNKVTTFPTEFIPLVHVELADQTADTVAQDMGVVGLKFLRGRIVAKSGIAATELFSVIIRVDDVVGMTSAEVVYQSTAYTAIANDVKYVLDFYCTSDDGFRFVNVDVTNAGTWTFDLILDAA